MIATAVAGVVALSSRLGKTALRLIRTPTGQKVAIVLACLLAALGYGELRYHAGVRHEQAAQAERLKVGKKVVAKVAEEGAAISKDVRQRLDTKTVEIRWRTQILKEEVPVYVPFEVDRSTVVPDGFVWMHDAAALGSALPATPGGPVEAASGIALSEVADTVVENYGACHVLRAEVVAWREWYPRIAALWAKYVKTVAPEPGPTATP